MNNFVKMRDLGLREIVRDIKRMGDRAVEVGYFKNMKAAGGGSMAVVAATQEFGSPKKNIPSRPFMRQAYDTNKGKIESVIRKLYGSVLDDKTSVDAALKKIGVMHESQIRNQIVRGSFVANAIRTILAKGSSKPLIDTGAMRQSVSHRTVRK